MLSKIISAGLLLLVSMAAHSNSCENHMRYGAPSDVDKVLCRDGYSAGYDYSKKASLWVAYDLTVSSVFSDAAKRTNVFFADKDIPSKFRAKNSDFKRSGYDRGHLAPAATIDYSRKALDETFLLTNIVPQLPGFNRDGWGYKGAWGALEHKVRSMVVKYGEVYVIAGPIYNKSETKVIGNAVPVPTHFYKLVVDPEYNSVISFILPHVSNSSKELANYITSVNCVEQATGLDFLSELPDQLENDIENGVAKGFNLWAMQDGNSDILDCK